MSSRSATAAPPSRSRRATAPRSGSGSSGTRCRPTTGTTTSSPIGCCGSAQHYLWGLAESPDWDQGLHNAWENGYCAVNRNFADVVVDELARAAGRDRLLPRLPPLRRAAARPPRRARGDPRPLRAHPLAAAGLLARPPRGHPPGGARRDPRQRRRRLPHGPVAAQLPAQLRGHPRRRRRSRRERDAPRRSHHPRDGTADLRRRPGVRPPRAERSRVVRREKNRGAPAGVPRPARRPHRPVQERRAGAACLRALPRGASRAARPRADACLSRPVAAGHPRVRRVPCGDPARGANRERPLPDGRLDAARPADRRQLRAVGGGVQAVRRSARQRDLRRHEPGREGGAARERA